MELDYVIILLGFVTYLVLVAPTQVIHNEKKTHHEIV